MNLGRIKEEKHQVARNGEILGEYSLPEILIITQHPSGAITLTDHVFSPARNEWIRISELIADATTAPRYGPQRWLLSLAIIALAALVLSRYFLGSWQFWNL